MAIPQSFIAFAPFGVGVLCALFYFERGAHVYGWWIGARDSDYHSAYFKLEDYFSAGPTRFYASEGTDLYGGWKWLYAARPRALDKPLPVEEEAARELDRLQGRFAAEWLFYEDDEQIASETAAYHRMELAVRHVNIRANRLARLDRSQPVWLYRSRGFDRGVLEYLARYWPLDYGGA